MYKFLLYGLLSLSSSVYVQCTQEQTYALHAEARCGRNPILTQETHPVLYAMVANLAHKANIDMPRYISTYDVHGLMVSRNGIVYTVTRDIQAYVDVMGDLYICSEILTDLPYEVVEGIIAVAMAEKASNNQGKIALVGCGTFVSTIAGLYYLNKTYDLKLDSRLLSMLIDHSSCFQSKKDILQTVLCLLVVPALLAANLASNYVQKSTDIKAAKFVGAQAVIDGIQGIVKLNDMYSKENIFSRIASALKLKSIYNFLFYPVRAYTEEERVHYLRSL